MSSLERIAACANTSADLFAQLKELVELRERLKSEPRQLALSHLSATTVSPEQLREDSALS
jgi:hypothetical protein